MPPVPPPRPPCAHPLRRDGHPAPRDPRRHRRGGRAVPGPGDGPLDLGAAGLHRGRRPGVPPAGRRGVRRGAADHVGGRARRARSPVSSRCAPQGDGVEEVSFAGHPAHRGRGVVTAAVRLMCAYAFDAGCAGGPVAHPPRELRLTAGGLEGRVPDRRGPGVGRGAARRGFAAGTDLGRPAAAGRGQGAGDAMAHGADDRGRRDPAAPVPGRGRGEHAGRARRPRSAPTRPACPPGTRSTTGCSGSAAGAPRAARSPGPSPTRPPTGLLGGVDIGRLDVPLFAGTGILGFWLLPDARGRGVVGKALELLIPYAWRPVDDGGLGLHQLTAGCAVGNRASARALRRSGVRARRHRAAGDPGRRVGRRRSGVRPARHRRPRRPTGPSPAAPGDRDRAVPPAPVDVPGRSRSGRGSRPREPAVHATRRAPRRVHVPVVAAPPRARAGRRRAPQLGHRRPRDRPRSRQHDGVPARPRREPVPGGDRLLAAPDRPGARGARRGDARDHRPRLRPGSGRAGWDCRGSTPRPTSTTARLRRCCSGPGSGGGARTATPSATAPATSPTAPTSSCWRPTSASTAGRSGSTR